jgi:hypothetical protein
VVLEQQTKVLLVETQTQPMVVVVVVELVPLGQTV